MDVEVLVLHGRGFEVGCLPLAVGHVIDLDFILVCSFGDCVYRILLVDLFFIKTFT